MKSFKEMSDAELHKACDPILHTIGMEPKECVHEGVADAWGKIVTNPKVKSECEAFGAKGYGDWVQVCKRICKS
jgi:hypothetical protein